jgi:putative oxidoreductase
MKLMTKLYTNYSTIVMLMRIVLGIIFFAHGAQKVLGWYGGKGLSASVEIFQNNLGLPPVLFYISAFTEFLGGLFMILGFLTRIFSAGLAINMIVAILLVHISKGLFTSNGGFEFPLSLLVFSLCIFLIGPGSISIDRFLFKSKKTSSS